MQLSGKSKAAFHLGYRKELNLHLKACLNHTVIVTDTELCNKFPVSNYILITVKIFFCKDTPIDDLFQKIGIRPISSNGKVFSPPDKFPGRQNLGGDQ